MQTTRSTIGSRPYIRETSNAFGSEGYSISDELGRAQRIARGGSSFRAYVEQFLLPPLRPGNIVVMDNLGSHKGKAVRRLIRGVGAKLFFLPRYSPDLNPIEQVFTKLRKTDPRSIEAAWRGIGTLLHFTRQECANYLAHTGYAST